MGAKNYRKIDREANLTVLDRDEDVYYFIILCILFQEKIYKPEKWD